MFKLGLNLNVSLLGSEFFTIKPRKTINNVYASLN